MSTREKVAADSAYNDMATAFAIVVLMLVVVTTLAVHYMKEVARLCQ